MSRPQGPTLFIGNVPQSAKVEDLETLFRKYGRIINCTIRADARGRPFGYGFVEMDDEKDAQDAIAALNNHEMGGSKLRVDRSRSRTEAGDSRSAPPPVGERPSSYAGPPRAGAPPSDGFSVVIENLPDHASWQVRCGARSSGFPLEWMPL